MKNSKQPCLFLDRDGVINKELGYVYQIEQFEFIEGVFAALRQAREKGFLLVIVTNQSGIARRLYSEADYFKLNDWMLAQFKAQHIVITDVYHCPHHPQFTGHCDCRKPEPGMILRAAGEHAIDLAGSVMVGDKASDMLAAEKAGIPARFLVQTGHNLPDAPVSATAILPTLSDVIAKL